ncbi:hypothetical protein ACFR99_04815 [Haloarchaeobius amylolyticus]|uniref:Uncharacterized protein n=1 Tax=Haloarchaeobius amylolyticus TaxID=1198296 RepID=A0ABD6BCP5_9EURY
MDLNAEPVIAGDGPKCDELERIAVENVKFASYVKQNKKETNHRREEIHAQRMV